MIGEEEAQPLVDNRWTVVDPNDPQSLVLKSQHNQVGFWRSGEALAYLKRLTKRGFVLYEEGGRVFGALNDVGWSGLRCDDVWVDPSNHERSSLRICLVEELGKDMLRRQSEQDEKVCFLKTFKFVLTAFQKKVP